MTIEIADLARAALAHISGASTPWRVTLDKTTLPAKVRAFLHAGLTIRG